MWHSTLNNSINSNRQLEFVYNIQIAYLDAQLLPAIDSILFRRLQSHTLYAFIDLRTKLAVIQNSQAPISLLWYFPLSKEKYIIKATYKLYKSDDQIAKEHWEKLVSKEERKSYHSLHPDMPTSEMPQQTDLDKFNA